jgi:hypothetical protein
MEYLELALLLSTFWIVGSTLKVVLLGEILDNGAVLLSVTV